MAAAIGAPSPSPVHYFALLDEPSPIARSANLHMDPGEIGVTMGMQMEATVSIQIFGNTKNDRRPMARQMAVDLNSSLLKQTVLDFLKGGGISIQEVGRPRNFSALEETRYEERFGFEITIGLAQNVQDKPEVIETIDLEADVSGHTIDRTIDL